ncbi:P44/Msp2 family outer membrane protein [Ehrlichia minasensis]|uniref:P44/Msp2 family outer membrane protein n=1 Tax=Ehrlichia minasensis TaxID=1242993 RepID=A0A4Q6I6H4_9RICK|nr:P44/Msp2 family outer membrane protein [Ehrlichia minasensis]RZB12266.1 P44/Msp2 family outer membrane protein [Ehrlichia minasensis]
MNCKKVFIIGALISSIYFLPNVSYSNSVHSMHGNFYIAGKYMPGVPHFGVFSAEEEKENTTRVFGLKENWDGSAISTKSPDNIFIFQNYLFKYQSNKFLGFAGAIGYSVGRPRIEFEVSYETFDVKNPGDNYANDAHRYYALSRCDYGECDDMSGAKDKFVFLINEGLLDISFMTNVCYDITAEKMPFSPYICAGIGADLIHMFETTSSKISYQGKLGLAYPISAESSVSFGIYFHKIVNDKFKNIPAMVPIDSKIIGPQFTTVTLNVCHFGLELGGRFNF